jgi:hypothetical protein
VLDFTALDALLIPDVALHSTGVTSKGLRFFAAR